MTLNFKELSTSKLSGRNLCEMQSYRFRESIKDPNSTELKNVTEKKSPTDDETFCKSIAKSISDILRFSLDDEFRRSCFQLFEVSSTQETEIEVKKRLIHLIQNENTNFTDFQNGEVTLQNQNETISRIEASDKENQNKECADQNDKVPILSPRAQSNENIQTVPQNIYKRNWLQISSQQYKEIIKRKKLNFYSQPPFGHNYQNDLEFFTCENSQTSFSCPLSSHALTEPLGYTASYFKSKFEDSFKDNAQKCLKNNLRYHRHL